jgi:hypothetical protein
VKELGDDLLAGAVLAGDEHVRVRRANLRDEFEDRLHGGCAGDEFRHTFRAEKPVFKLELAGTAQGLMQFGVHLDETDEAFVFPGFLDEVARAPLHALDREIDVAPGGHHDHGQARVHLLNAREKIETFLAGCRVACVVEVDEQDIVVGLAQRLQGELRRADTVDDDSLRLQKEFYSLKDVRLVVGDEDADFGLLTRNG